MSKKKTQLWITLSLCMVMAQWSGAADPIVYYSFDELGATVLDESGNGNDGIPSGGLVLEDAGQYGKCFGFNGTDAYVELDRPIQDDFSLLAWIKTSDEAPGTAHAYQGNGLFWSDVAGGANDLVVGVINTRLSFFAGNPDTSVNSNADVVIDEWIHIAAVRQAASGAMSIYLNGELDNSITHTNTGPLDAQPLMAIGGNTLDNRYYDGLMDDVLIYDLPLTEKEIQTAMAGLGPELASDPSPAHELTDVPRDGILSWTPGDFARTHDVYLGTVWTDVNDATNPVSQGQDAATFDPGRLEFGQTYFWRVDEVNGAPDNTVFKGAVWSFEVEPHGRPITNITATASSSSAANMGPDKTVDGSGLDALDQHSVTGTDMWLSGPGANPWIQYDFDKVYKLDALLVWNSNQMIESFVGLGAKDVVIETSADGIEWTVLEGASLFNQATGAASYTANTVIDFEGALAQSVRITISAGYGMMPQYGLSEVRFLYIPTFASESQPIDSSITDDVHVVLGWRSGREAVSHQVHLGTDALDLALLGTTHETTYAASNLDYSNTYYWSVTEVNEAEAVSSYAGDVWSFTTPDYSTVDDFDQYDDKCNRIFFAWEDGLGHSGGEEIEGCDVAPSNGNGGGSIVGNEVAPFAERTIVNIGGSTQSLPFNYDNAFGPSEAARSIPGQDWTVSGVQTLAVAFLGTEGNTGTMYVKINNSKIVYDGDAADIGTAAWQSWNIDLTGVSGLQNITSLTIGVDGGSATGMLYIDDIRLYP
jgi:hypothetical protein